MGKFLLDVCNVMNGIPSMPKVFAFIQARTSSTRLPGKVLRILTKNPDKTILDHLLGRLSKVLPTNQIVLLIPTGDVALKEYALKNQVEFLEGPEEDVRERFIRASQKYNPDWILRLTADNPYLDILHLELLIESTRFTDAELLSFQGLPLGTTGEIFTTKALVQFPEDKLEPRHREHVSLHIKEFPEKFKIVKLKSLLTLEEQEISTLLRLTIDEEKDFELSSELFEKRKDFPFFGISEIISYWRENSKFFEKNADVNQVKFSIPAYNFYISQKILILYGNISKYGSGHLERMKLLYVYLLSLGYDVSIQEFSAEISSEFTLYILDARDEKIPISLQDKKWICIDNQGIVRNKYFFFDSLPHPKLDLEWVSESILAPDLSFIKPNPQTETILVYAGGLSLEDTMKLEKVILDLYSEVPIQRIGGHFSTINTRIEVLPRLYRYEFLQKIADAKFVITYFGQTAMESLLLGKEVLLYSISEYHSELAKILENFCDCQFIGNVQKKEFPIFSQRKKMNKKFQLQNLGFSKIIEEIQNQLQ